MELEQMAPSVAARIDLKNPRRVVRALEIAHRHGGEHVASPSRTPPPFDFTAIGLTLERAKLYDRLNARTDVMFEDGWVGEVAMLQKMGHGPELPSMSSLGYLEIFEVLSGDRTLEDAAETIKRKTRRFARKQYAWFRLNDERIRWFESTRSGFDEAVDYAKRRWESHVIAGNSVSSDSS
jgi:tRNA dimethylallyltransferase